MIVHLRSNCLSSTRSVRFDVSPTGVAKLAAKPRFRPRRAAVAANVARRIYHDCEMNRNTDENRITSQPPTLTAVKTNGRYMREHLSILLYTHIYACIYLICVLHLLEECSALSVKRPNILGSQYLSYEKLGNMHWQVLLRLAKASRRF